MLLWWAPNSFRAFSAAPSADHDVFWARQARFTPTSLVERFVFSEYPRNFRNIKGTGMVVFQMTTASGIALSGSPDSVVAGALWLGTWSGRWWRGSNRVVHVSAARDRGHWRPTAPPTCWRRARPRTAGRNPRTPGAPLTLRSPPLELSVDRPTYVLRDRLV